MIKLMMVIAAGLLMMSTTPPKPPTILDTQLGPVVAIKREIIDVYSNCLAHVVGDTDKPMYLFTCSLDFATDHKKEVFMSTSPLFRFTEDTCSVEGNYSKGNLILFFGNPRAPSTFDDMKLCLKKGTDSIQNKLDILLFKYN